MNLTAYDKAYHLSALAGPHILLCTVRGQFHTLHLPAVCRIPLIHTSHHPHTSSPRRDRRLLRMPTNPVVPLINNPQLMAQPVYQRVGSKHLPLSFFFVCFCVSAMSSFLCIARFPCCRMSVLVLFFFFFDYGHFRFIYERFPPSWLHVHSHSSLQLPTHPQMFEYVYDNGRPL